MPTREPRERFTLTVQNNGNSPVVPMMPRLRRLLKAMLRGYGIRCVNIVPTVSSQATTQRHPKEGKD